MKKNAVQLDVVATSVSLSRVPRGRAIPRTTTSIRVCQLFYTRRRPQPLQRFMVCLETATGCG